MWGERAWLPPGQMLLIEHWNCMQFELAGATAMYQRMHEKEKEKYQGYTAVCMR